LTVYRNQRSVQQKGRKPRKERSRFAKRENMGRTCLSVLKQHSITCRSRANERLMAQVREQALEQAREAAALAERNRIARELHDSIK
jgi:signal transduction histidine kinase